MSVNSCQAIISCDIVSNTVVSFYFNCEFTRLSFFSILKTQNREPDLSLSRQIQAVPSSWFRFGERLSELILFYLTSLDYLFCYFINKFSEENMNY